jgi:hypothetical protein
MSVAFDPAANSVYTVSVPNARNRKLVVSRFDRRDLTLSEEFVPQLTAGGPLVLSGKGRSLDEYYVTGATIVNGRLYALSAAYRTLLSIDLAKKAVTAAFVLPELHRPVGLAFRSDELYVVSDGRVVAVFERPARTD